MPANESKEILFHCEVIKWIPYTALYCRQLALAKYRAKIFGRHFCNRNTGKYRRVFNYIVQKEDIEEKEDIDEILIHDILIFVQNYFFWLQLNIFQRFYFQQCSNKFICNTKLSKHKEIVNFKEDIQKWKTLEKYILGVIL